MDKNIKTINKIYGKCMKVIPLLRRKYKLDIKNVISAIDSCNKCYI